MDSSLVPSKVNTDDVFLRHYDWYRAIVEPKKVHEENCGYAGFGISSTIMQDLIPGMIVFAIIFYFCRLLGKQVVFPWIGRHVFGIKKSNRRLNKFGYQAWLFVYYAVSSIYGYWAGHDYPWFQFPLDGKGHMNLWNNHPAIALAESLPIRIYFWSQTGFYCAELLAIFIETKRSDFLEYLIHHTSTLFLVTTAVASYNHKIGILTLFLHDFSDIWLCLAKMCHYSGKENWVNVFFAVFFVSFAYLRLYCFPQMVWSCFFVNVMIRPMTDIFWIQSYAYVLLLLLHCYWFYLLIKMLIRLATGVHGDVRSDDDEETNKHNPNAKKHDKTK